MAGRLDGEASPWLARGAAQPVDWRPFGEAAFAEARPVLLVLGTATSHACHALDDECFDDPAIAKLVDARFVPVRVDADERPDVDARYQPAAMPSWPLVCIPERGFAAAHLSRGALLKLLSADVITVGHADANVNAGGDADPIEKIRAQLSKHGGFGAPPKHPHAPALELLWSRPEPWAREHALRTLDAMAQGGIHDQLAGGFHRYSVDDRWVVPHFEKRAQDQAGLLRAYVRAFAATGEARYAEVARGIVGFVERRLFDRERGGFGCGEDCDVGAYDDGTHYTWTVEEARGPLDAREWAVAQRAFDIYGRGELHSDPTRNVLFRALAPSEIARDLGIAEDDARALEAAARKKLLAAREQRPRPAVDRSVYVEPNADLARALLEAAAPLGLPEARTLATRTLERLLGSLVDGRPPRRVGAPVRSPWLSDYAQLGLAAADAGDAARAASLAEAMLADFPHPEAWSRDGAAASPAALAVRLLAAVGDRDRARELARAGLATVAHEGVAAAGLVLSAALVEHA